MTTLGLWDPQTSLRRVSQREADLSRGFLRCQPEKWFPGMESSWMSLAQTLGAEIRFLEAKPLLGSSFVGTLRYKGALNGETVELVLDEEAEAVLGGLVLPGVTNHQAREVTVEYLARRLLSTLGSAWSGPESSHFQYVSTDLVQDGYEQGDTEAPGVRVSVLVNGRQCSMWIALGPRFVSAFDGLWRRQIHSTAKIAPGNYKLHFEIAQLAVPPSMLADYMRAGTVIDLEVPASDVVTLRVSGQPWLTARLCNVMNHLGFEVLPAPVSVPGLPEGTTRVSIEFPSVVVDAAFLSELSQHGALYNSGHVLSERVEMVINSEKVADAQLNHYQGRFAITVLGNGAV